jgi:hypothetical protein
MRSNKELELLPYNLEIEENAKKLKKEKQETHKKIKHHGKQRESTCDFDQHK